MKSEWSSVRPLIYSQFAFTLHKHCYIISLAEVIIKSFKVCGSGDGDIPSVKLGGVAAEAAPEIAWLTSELKSWRILVAFSLTSTTTKTYQQTLVD